MILKFIQLAVILFLFVFSSQAQQPIHQWVKTFKSTLDTKALEIAKDPNGDYIILGNFDHWVDVDLSENELILGDSLYSWYSGKAFVAKFNKQGNLKWAKSFESPLDLSPGGGAGLRMTEMDVSVSGDIFLSGTYVGICDFDPGVGEFVLSNIGTTNLFLLKLNSEGDFEWVNEFNPTSIVSWSGSVDVNSIITDLDDNVYLSGAFKGGLDFDPDPLDSSFYQTGYQQGSDGYIVKFSSDGDFVWSQVFGEYGDDDVPFLKRGLDNDLYMGCIYHDSIKISVAGQDVLLNHSPGPFQYQYEQDFFYARMDTSGQLEWVQQITGNGSQKIDDMEVDSNGDIYICGDFLGVLKFPPFTNEAYSYYVPGAFQQYPDAFVAKLNNQGEIMWGQVIATPKNDRMNKITLDDEDGLYLGGFIGDSLFIGADFINYSYVIDYNGRQGALIKCSKTDGAVEWVNRYETTVTSEVNDFELEENALFTVGASYGPTDFDLSSDGEDIVSSAFVNYSYDTHGFLHKMIFTTDTLNYPNFSIFPNPTNSSVNLFVEDFENLVLSIVDMQGRLINELQLESKLTTIDLSGQAAGVYFMVIKSNEQQTVMRVVKE